MEEAIISRIRGLEDFPELIHSIQSMLPVKDAARTCILNKSWLHAWSTIPTLRFHQSGDDEEQQKNHATMVDRTLHRYHRDNIPMESFDLEIDIKNQELAFLVENWVRSIATKSCLNQLSLKVVVSIASFTLPDELFSGENLKTVSIMSTESNINSLWISRNLVIKSVFLRELHLFFVQMSVEVFDNLVSTCSLLESIELIRCKGLNTIKIKNLEFLYELRINSVEPDINLVIEDVPNLRLIKFYLKNIHPNNPLPFKMVSIPSLTQLTLFGMIVDDSFFDMIRLNFPLLKSLTLFTDCRRLESFTIRCVPLKRLFLYSLENRFIEAQVYAPNLRAFSYYGKTMPRLLFPIMAPKYINFGLLLASPIDDSFFVKTRENLEISSMFTIVIFMNSFDIVLRSNIDIDDLREKVPIPATNVHAIQFTASSGYQGSLEQYSSFFVAFFCICHPIYVVASLDSRTADGNQLFKAIVRLLMDLMEKRTSWPVYDLIDVEIKNPRTEEWEYLTRSFPDESILPDDHPSSVEFRLFWHSL